uniref:C2H2-type domain-containing protein n=1 Tax=Steinernema glaseri TaxID=37863 RepID=A0A1I8AQA1_9BILA
MNEVKEGYEIVEEHETVAKVVEDENGNMYLEVSEDDIDIDFREADDVEVQRAPDGAVTFILSHIVEEEVEPAQEPRECVSNKDDMDARTPGHQVPSHNYHPAIKDALDALHGHGGINGRRNRVYGSCLCPKCGQSFVNTARLERHLAVHQPFGSYLCPLCGKTYKYEYNLFFHWRQNCRDLGELLSIAERKSMDVNVLRDMVENVAQKKIEIGPIDIVHREAVEKKNEAQTVYSAEIAGKRGAACMMCGVYVLAAQMPRHAGAHIGRQVSLDECSPCGGYFCDLCGLLFREKENLYKHWRTSCHKIRMYVPSVNETDEVHLPDSDLLEVVNDLLKQSTMTAYMNQGSQSEHQQEPILDVYKRRLLEQIADGHPIPNSSGESTGSEAPETLVFADDFMDNEVPEAEQNRVKKALWEGQRPFPNVSLSAVMDEPVHCSDCMRTFTDAGSLERHFNCMHSEAGSHRCILCGNGFKYDYNLLYHYRRSCPYTKYLISLEEREQMEAVDLRKAVRAIAARGLPVKPALMEFSQEKEDEKTVASTVREEMMKKPISAELPPPHLREPVPGRNGKQCDVCGVFFYGKRILQRHVKMAHATEYSDWLNRQASESGEPPKGEEDVSKSDVSKRKRPAGESPPMLTAEEESSPPRKKEASPIDMPPVLTAEEPTYQPEEGALFEQIPPASAELIRTYEILDEYGNAVAQSENYEELRQFMQTSHLDPERYKIMLVEFQRVEGGYAQQEEPVANGYMNMVDGYQQETLNYDYSV